MVDHWSLGTSLVLWPTAVRQGTQLFDQAGIVHARAKVEGRLRSRVGRAAAGRGLVTHVAHVQAIVQFPGGLAAQVDERGILGPSLPGVYYARLVAELRPLTYGLVGHKTKLMPKDQWSTILGHSPDVADALIQSMLLAA